MVQPVEQQNSEELDVSPEPTSEFAAQAPELAEVSELQESANLAEDSTETSLALVDPSSEKDEFKNSEVSAVDQLEETVEPPAADVEASDAPLAVQAQSESSEPMHAIDVPSEEVARDVLPIVQDQAADADAKLPSAPAFGIDSEDTASSVKTAPTYGEADRPASSVNESPVGLQAPRKNSSAQTDKTSQSKVGSALGKMWKMPRHSEASAELIAIADNSAMLAKLLIARGISDATEANAFLNMENYQATSPMELPDVDKAVARITQAIVMKENITIYGDYDVDGVTGTSVLYTVLKRLGASVSFYIPNRATEGYGLNLKAISILASKHRTKLIITCDCGVSNFAEINFAKSLGVESLVLDHHSMPELLPPAVGIVHPKRLDENHPLFHLPGVGVAYKVCEALLIDQGRESEVAELLDFVTLGMIADMVPLIRENRYLVKVGLPYLAKSPRPGIKALLSQIGKFEDTDLVGFGLAPRINAVGRLSDANAAVELMTTDDPDTAERLAKQLQIENERRQELCEKIFNEADRHVSSTIDLANDKAIAIFGKDWHHGVVGIVASRLVEKYARPVFIGEHDEHDGVVKGSARSVDGVDLYQVLKANEHLLTRWGGHKMAAGFAMEADRAHAACRSIVETCNRMLASKSSAPVLEIDASVDATEVSIELVQLLKRLAPFGMNNKKPIFCMQSVTCSSTRPLGKEGKHSRIMILDASQTSAFECVMWNTRGRVPTDGTTIDVAFTAEINSYNGRDRLQLVLADWRVSGRDTTSGASRNGGSFDEYSSETEETASVVAVELAGARSLKPGPLEVVARVASVIDETREGELNKIAEKARVQKELLELNTAAARQRAQSFTSSKYVWKDLRSHGQPLEIVNRAIQKLGGEVAIFGESCPLLDGIKFADRTSIQGKQHIIFWQMPPSEKVFQEILAKNPDCNIYLLAPGTGDCDEPQSFLKRLFGVIRYAVNKKDGQVEGEKLGAAMGSTKMSVALGLTVLRRVGLIDWFSEDGCIFLDLVGAAEREAEELAEYKQLVSSLETTSTFRDWCTTAKLDDIQLAVTPNHVAASPELVASAVGEPSIHDEDM